MLNGYPPEYAAINAAVNFLYETFNCTLWNWNVRTNRYALIYYILLIVPYGIETGFEKNQWFLANRLLIVPYGIETAATFLQISERVKLLIVPYGIETSLNTKKVLHTRHLLIVPYGIETSFQVTSLSGRNTFNCTLWNWNVLSGSSGCFLSGLLIVPYGIETAVMLLNHRPLYSFNCTLWNWNGCTIYM